MNPLAHPVLLVLVALAPVQDSAPATRPDPLAAVAFLAGAWVQDQGGTTFEEHWMQPRGGTMVGMAREVRPGRAASFEHLRMVVEEGVPTYLASPMGRPPTPFRLVEHGPGLAVFENPGNDFPSRLIYRREGSGTLRVELLPRRGVERKKTELVLHRMQG